MKPSDSVQLSELHSLVSTASAFISPIITGNSEGPTKKNFDDACHNLGLLQLYIQKNYTQSSGNQLNLGSFTQKLKNDIGVIRERIGKINAINAKAAEREKPLPKDADVQEQPMKNEEKKSSGDADKIKDTGKDGLADKQDDQQEKEGFKKDDKEIGENTKEEPGVGAHDKEGCTALRIFGWCGGCLVVLVSAGFAGWRFFVRKKLAAPSADKPALVS